MRRFKMLCLIVCLLGVGLLGCSTIPKVKPVFINCTIDAKNARLGDASREMNLITQMGNQYVVSPADDPVRPKPNGRTAFEREVQRRITAGEISAIQNVVAVYADGTSHQFMNK